MYIKVEVMPDSKKELLKELSVDSFSISVKEKAKQNQANYRVREILAHHFSVSFERIRIISGHRSPKKIISVEI